MKPIVSAVDWNFCPQEGGLLHEVADVGAKAGGCFPSTNGKNPHGFQAPDRHEWTKSRRALRLSRLLKNQRKKIRSRLAKPLRQERRNNG